MTDDIVVGYQRCHGNYECGDEHAVMLSDLAPEARMVLKLCLDWFDANAARRHDLLYPIEQAQGEAFFRFAASVRGRP